MTDLGTLPGYVSSSGEGINDKGQVLEGSYDASGNPRPFLWQNSVMTDLNTLIPSVCHLYLLEATGTINDRGQIAGYALVKSTGETHAFLATPVRGEAANARALATAAARARSVRPNISLPENVSNLQKQRAFGRFKTVRPR